MDTDECASTTHPITEEGEREERAVGKRVVRGGRHAMGEAIQDDHRHRESEQYPWREGEKVWTYLHMVVMALLPVFCWVRVRWLMSLRMVEGLTRPRSGHSVRWYWVIVSVVVF